MVFSYMPTQHSGLWVSAYSYLSKGTLHPALWDSIFSCGHLILLGLQQRL